MRDLFQNDDGGWLQDAKLARPACQREARTRRGGDPRRGMEMGRGRDGFPLRPHLWASPSPGRTPASERGGGGDARGASSRSRRARGDLFGRRRDPRGCRRPAFRDRNGVRGFRATSRPLCARGCRPRRRFCQHRRFRQASHRARLCAPRRRTASRRAGNRRRRRRRRGCFLVGGEQCRSCGC